VKLKHAIIAVTSFFLFLAASAQTQTESSVTKPSASSPVGLWKTIDDKTGKPRGFIRVFERAGKLHGRIERSAIAGEETRVCEVCKDERKDKPYQGMEILRNMAAGKDSRVYVDGDILDPDSGTVYRCKITLAEDGKQLQVRGFIGVSLLGRTQVWLREE
jgi:uncharacterized protein (DUF2147 family)